MVINFRAHEISRGARKLIKTLILIRKMIIQVETDFRWLKPHKEKTTHIFGLGISWWLDKCGANI